MKISELKPGQKKISIKIKAIDKSEPREVTSQLDGKYHKVCECLIGDETGCILLSLWDEQIGEMHEKKHYQIENAYTSLFKHSLRLNLSSYGTIKQTEDTFQADTSNNQSLKEF